MSIGRGLLLRSWPFPNAALLIAIRAATTAFIIFALLLPANAQFWGNSLGWRQQQPQQPYNPYGGFGGDRQWDWGYRQPAPPRQRERPREVEKEHVPDYSQTAPGTPAMESTVQ